jgi:DnaK suppressor protein
MNDAELAQFKAQIIARLTELEAEHRLGEEGQATVELDQQAVGRLSRMDALQNQAMAKAGAKRRDLERSRLETALSRMDQGEYGYCEDCGDDIALRRLKLDPAAAKCIDCARG